MSYAKFATESEAQAYADAVQSALSQNPAYIADRWSDITAGSDGYFYVSANPIVPFDQAGELPTNPPGGEL